MAVNTRVRLELEATESRTTLLGGSSIAQHRLAYPHPLVNGGLSEFASGTANYQGDLVYEFGETLAATTRTFDLHTSLSQELAAAAFSPIEITGIWIFNDALVAASILILGNGAAPAYVNLFGAAAHTIRIPPLGCFVWESPLRGAGLVVTNTTAQDFKLDAGIASIPYRMILRGRSA
jgi:hypothetical protein